MFTNSQLMREAEGLKKFAYRLSRNSFDAEDLLQSTLLRAIEKKHLFDGSSNLFSWTSKIMYNLFVTDYRRKTKHETQFDPENYLKHESVEATQEVKMELKNVKRAMQTLSDDHKDVLVMVCVKGLQYARVAEILDIPVGTVRSRLSRAREALQYAMDNVSSGQNKAFYQERVLSIPEAYQIAAHAA